MWTHINSIWLDGIIPDDMREEISAVEHENPRNIKGGNLNAMARDLAHDAERKNQQQDPAYDTWRKNQQWHHPQDKLSTGQH